MLKNIYKVISGIIIKDKYGADGWHRTNNIPSTPTSQIRMPASSPEPSHLLICTLGDNTFKYLRPQQSCNRVQLNSQLLVLAWPDPSCCRVSWWMRVLPISFLLSLSLSLSLTFT